MTTVTAPTPAELAELTNYDLTQILDAIRAIREFDPLWEDLCDPDWLPWLSPAELNDDRIGEVEAPFRAEWSERIAAAGLTPPPTIARHPVRDEAGCLEEGLDLIANRYALIEMGRVGLWNTEEWEDEPYGAPLAVRFVGAFFLPRETSLDMIQGSVECAYMSGGMDSLDDIDGGLSVAQSIVHAVIDDPAPDLIEAIGRFPQGRLILPTDTLAEVVRYGTSDSLAMSALDEMLKDDPAAAMLLARDLFEVVSDEDWWALYDVIKLALHVALTRPSRISQVL
jgi:hypothetical protein